MGNQSQNPLNGAKISIYGAGLIGTSIGLGLRQLGGEVTFFDPNSKNAQAAQDLVGGEPAALGSVVLVIVATPIERAKEALFDAFDKNPQATFIDITGLKSELINEVEQFPALAERFCSTHPMAGREFSGPLAAQADLFQGRTWIFTPTSRTNVNTLELTKTLIAALGGSAKELDAATHDRAIATVSHLPQVMSSLTAGALIGVAPVELEVAGQGLRDTTRLAESSSELWANLLLSNREEVVSLLTKIDTKLQNLITSLESNDVDGVKEFMRNGNQGRSAIPGKHGGKKRDYTFLPIVIEDKPGELARIFDECKEADVNVEDLDIEHSPGQQTGLITLSLSKEDADVLFTHLSAKNWRVHAPRELR